MFSFYDIVTKVEAMFCSYCFLASTIYKSPVLRHYFSTTSFLKGVLYIMFVQMYIIETLDAIVVNQYKDVAFQLLCFRYVCSGCYTSAQFSVRAHLYALVTLVFASVVVSKFRYVGFKAKCN